MCGISGIVTRSPLQPEQAELVARINSRQVHRGPDGEGRFNADHVALAMRRLSIIDVEAGGQPLYNEDRSLALVCNGEIYNFVELRTQLEHRGHRFGTGSDCETILHLYEEHGDECVQHLRGMFAFALWDSRRRRVLLARDRMGEKPLYLACTDSAITFASELRALVHAGVVPFELDPDAIHLYFHYGYVPEPLSAVKGLRKLPAAHTLSIEIDSWSVDERCYWRMEDAPELEGDPVSLIRDELERIAELIVRSDVPVGIALSGGLDSSVIACLTSKRYPDTMQAISVGYSGNPIQDERGDAHVLAEHLGMPFHQVELTVEDLLSLMRHMPYDRDEPFADMSGVSYYAVLRKARELGIPVMLFGHGGDELFWGYRWVREAVHATRRKQALRNGGDVGLRDYLKVSRPPFSYANGMRWLFSLGGLQTGLQQHRGDRLGPEDRMVFYDTEPPFAAAARSGTEYYASDFVDQIEADRPFDLFTIPTPWPPIDVAITRLICDTYLVENGLAQGDRLSMATSVEMRQPLVDYRLVETVIGLRKATDDSQLPAKHWFREATEDVVPPFVSRRRKRGFGVPWRQWNTALADAFGSQLADGYLVEHHVLSSQGARSLAASLAPGPLGLPVYAASYALMLEMWCQQMHGNL